MFLCTYKNNSIAIFFLISENEFRSTRAGPDDRQGQGGAAMWFDDDNGCSDASDGYVDVVSDAIYMFSLLAGVGALAVIVWWLT